MNLQNTLVKDSDIPKPLKAKMVLLIRDASPRIID